MPLNHSLWSHGRYCCILNNTGPSTLLICSGPWHSSQLTTELTYWLLIWEAKLWKWIFWCHMPYMGLPMLHSWQQASDKSKWHSKMGTKGQIGYLLGPLPSSHWQCFFSSQPTHEIDLSAIPNCLWQWLHNHYSFAKRNCSPQLGNPCLTFFRENNDRVLRFNQNMVSITVGCNCRLSWGVVDMLSTCCKVGQMLENFETNMAVYNTSYQRFLVCRAYQMMTLRKNGIYSFLIAFFVTRGLHCMKKWNKMLGSTFFCPKVQLLLSFFLTCFNMSDVSFGVGVGVINNFEMSQLQTFPTKAAG